MKKLFIILCVLSFSSTAFANWYIVNENNDVLSKIKYQPSTEDLATRNEVAVYEKKNIKLSEVEYRNGKIIKHKKTTKELDGEIEVEQKRFERNLISKKMRKTACDALISEGVVFKHIQCSNFE